MSKRSPSPARALAFATVRATFEQDAFTERAFRAEADRQRIEGRERAQAQRLAYGAVQRRGTSDVAIERLAGRSTRLLDPPVLAALRLGLYELLFADATPDHAAVDQAVELVKAAGAAHACGFVNAVLRRAARDRARLTADLLGDDSTPAAAAVADSAPRWLAEMWWRELGQDAARRTLAACNEPAEVAMRVDPLRADREAMRARLAEAGVQTRAAEAGGARAGPGMGGVGGRVGGGG
ncbi:MAG: transcription antitermination factor NusB, partial [Solirubrobacterales bacterium]